MENRSLDRGITVMECLARNGSCSLAELHRLTGLAKSTLRRLLATLLDRQIARRSVADGRYRINITLPTAKGLPIPPDLAMLVDVAMPHAFALTEAVRWPSDIHIRDGDTMRLVDSTRRLSPFPLYRGPVDRQLNIFGTASGLACLAALPDAEVVEIHRRTQAEPRWGLARFGQTLESYMDAVADARARGYGTRVTGYLGETIVDDGLSAIAVALIRRGRPAGALTLLWPRVFRTVPAFAEEFLPRLQQTADAVAADLARRDGDS